MEITNVGHLILACLNSIPSTILTWQPSTLVKWEHMLCGDRFLTYFHLFKAE